MILQKTNVDGLSKDITTGAIINTDRNAYEMYKAQRKVALEQQKTLQNVSDIHQEVETLKQDINDIKSMLSILIQREK
jgi:hypothetical protein